MGKVWSNIVFLLICVFSRIISTIYYIEDPESLRFALCVYDQYDLAHFQPDFPGYPIFCFIAKILYILFGSFSLAFSIIGGLSVYFIVIYIQKLLDIPLISLEGVLVAILIFFNPIIWLMSNQYMPDLAGTAVMIAAVYYLINDDYKNRHAIVGWFLGGILAGIRLSYLPLLILPCVYAFYNKKKVIQPLAFLSFGILFWLVPMIMDTGWNELVSIGEKHTFGHLYDFGNTVFTDNNYWRRFERLIQSIWADGLGGYWADRNPALLFNSSGILICCFFGCLILLSFGFPRSKVLIMTGSLALYTLWIYLFENIIYNSRYILPLIPFIVVLVAYGIIYFLVNYNVMYVKVLMLVFILCNVFVTIVLAVQHTYPTAIAQVKDYIVQEKDLDEEITIVSIPLVNEYLFSQKVKANYISVHQDSVSYYRERLNNVTSGRVLLIGNFPMLINRKPIHKDIFKHNPYVNRIWPEVYIYEYYFQTNN
ncbi:MAG: hypothetical protein K2X86_16385 [Cytophagaceae bacterium]|nr:hypothetical protein [Cytophagaceae bacterium]